MYYLYVKTHNKTGLKYLGQTHRDPYTYLGSGTRWLNHIRKHGNDISTYILLETECKTKLKVAGLQYSELFNVVADYSWANIVEEKGTGGDTSHSINFIKSLKTKNYDYKKDPEYRKKVSEATKLAWETKFADPKFNMEEYKQMCSKRSKDMWATKIITEQDRKRKSQQQTDYVNTPGVKEALSKKAKENWVKKSKTYEVTFPSGRIEIIKCLRGWCNDNNYPYYKLYNTIKNNKPSRDGWQVRIIKE